MSPGTTVLSRKQVLVQEFCMYGYLCSSIHTRRLRLLKIKARRMMKPSMATVVALLGLTLCTAQIHSIVPERRTVVTSTTDPNKLHLRSEVSLEQLTVKSKMFSSISKSRLSLREAAGALVRSACKPLGRVTLSVLRNSPLVSVSSAQSIARCRLLRAFILRPILLLRRRRICVTGAGGQTGRHVFLKLLTHDAEFTPVAIVRTEESKAELLEWAGFWLAQHAAIAKPWSGVMGEWDAASVRRSVANATVIVADVTERAVTHTALWGCNAVIIVTSATPQRTSETNENGRPTFHFPNGDPEEVDWLGQKNQIDALVAMVSCVTAPFVCRHPSSLPPYPPPSLHVLASSRMPSYSPR